MSIEFSIENPAPHAGAGGAAGTPAVDFGIEHPRMGQSLSPDGMNSPSNSAGVAKLKEEEGQADAAADFDGLCTVPWR